MGPMNMGYSGDYLQGTSGCCDGSTMDTLAPGAMMPATVMPSTVTPGTTMQVVPRPMGE